MRIPSQPHFGTIYQVSGHALVNNETLYAMHTQDIAYNAVEPQDLSYTTFQDLTGDTFVMTGQQDANSWLNGTLDPETLNLAIHVERVAPFTPQAETTKPRETSPFKAKSPQAESAKAKPTIKPESAEPDTEFDTLLSEGNKEARRRKVKQNTDSVFQEALMKFNKNRPPETKLSEKDARQKFETYKITHPIGQGGRQSKPATIAGNFIHYTPPKT
jgi:hypothetical protein